MKNQPTVDTQLTPEQREQLEADFTFRRIVELALDPVRGNFDAAHLKEINRRIFQDLPSVGLNDVQPGEFRTPVAPGADWIKNRGLSTVPGSHFVVYSRMDAEAEARLDKALSGARPDTLRDLAPAEFSEQIARLYTELDYIHPFSDGNSRTLRTFTQQLANEADYDLNWEKFGRTPTGRDLLYIARDIGVNQLAKPQVQSEMTLRKIIHTSAKLQGKQGMTELLRNAVRPLRAVAFERMTEAEALQTHPELEEAYRTVQAASAYFTAKAPGRPETQATAMQSVISHVQLRLDTGAINDFALGRERDRSKTRAPHPEAVERNSPDKGRDR